MNKEMIVKKTSGPNGPEVFYLRDQLNTGVGFKEYRFNDIPSEPEHRGKR